jgi:hypothetical protein
MDKMVGAMDNRAMVKTFLDKYNITKGKKSSTCDNRSKSPHIGPSKPQKSKVSVGAPSEEMHFEMVVKKSDTNVDEEGS